MLIFVLYMSCFINNEIQIFYSKMQYMFIFYLMVYHLHKKFKTKHTGDKRSHHGELLYFQRLLTNKIAENFNFQIVLFLIYLKWNKN